MNSSEKSHLDKQSSIDVAPGNSLQKKESVESVITGALDNIAVLVKYYRDRKCEEKKRKKSGRKKGGSNSKKRIKKEKDESLNSFLSFCANLVESEPTEEKQEQK